jgi:hypothetical protein
MKLLTRSAAVVCLAFLFTACGRAHDRADDIVADAPSGLFNGAEWSMRKASVSKSSDGTELTVRLFAEDVTDCAYSAPQDSTTGYLLWTMPAEEGRRSLKLMFNDTSENQTITFVTPPSTNEISVDGVILVNELTETTVNFGFIAESGEENAINGTVTATLCD